MAKGENFPLLVDAAGALSFTAGQGVKEWEIKQSDITKYGTNAYQLTGATATKTLSYGTAVQTESPVVGNKNQTWVFQFNQMVKDYFLPLPTRANLDLHYVDNPSVNLNTSAPAIAAAYNKFLKGTNGMTYFATNASTDWAIVNYYFIINNIMNAAVKPKAADPNVNPNLIKTLDAMKGQSLILISKNDLNSAVPTQFFLQGGLSAYDMGRLRGSSGFAHPRKWILASEELTNKTGIVNRPLDKTFRRFDHGGHEVAHALQELCGWIPIVDANAMCESERGRNSECFCYDTQNWFNSNAPSYFYPGIRAFNTQRADFMKKIFSETNTWMPPVDLRLDGYNPSGPAPIISSVKSLNSPLVNFEVYPNPTASEITIKGNLTEMKEIQITITDVLGRTVFQKKLEDQPLSFTYSISELGAKPAGVYYVKLTTGNTSKSSIFYKF
jgi:hypothetical protein